MNSLKVILLSVVIILCLPNLKGQSADFTVDPISPEISSRAPSDIYNSLGTALKIPHTQLGLTDSVNIDAFSYGADLIDPLGPGFWVAIQYSVSRQTIGLQGGPRIGDGAIRRQSNSNGAAGDKFFVKVFSGIIAGSVTPWQKGLYSDAPFHNLTPLPAVIESDLDAMALSRGPSEKVYFTLDRSSAQLLNYEPSDILIADSLGSIRIWAKRDELGLQLGDNIDAIAIKTNGPNTFDRNDLIWVSLDSISPSRIVSGGAEAIYLLSTGQPPHTLFTANNLNLENSGKEELNALTGFDPGPIPNLDSIRIEIEKQTEKDDSDEEKNYLKWILPILLIILTFAIWKFRKKT